MTGAFPDSQSFNSSDVAMEGTRFSDDLDGDIMAYTLPPRGCPICRSTAGLLRCGSCKVVSYCSTAHQSAHRAEHKTACNAVRKSREALEREEAALRAQPAHFGMPEDVFTNGVGNFWGILGTRDYMRARFAAADALLEVNTMRAIVEALAHFTDLMRLCSSDNMGVRDIIPSIMLRLGQEQECYDFLKQWAVIYDNGGSDSGENALPNRNIRNANVFEPIVMFRSEFPNLAHLVALALLKLRLYLDLEAYEGTRENAYGWHDDSDLEPDRPVGKLVRARVRTMDDQDLSLTVERVKEQCRELCQAVHDANPYFWEALVAEETPPIPQFYTHGSQEEADLVLHHCLRAWQESEDAMIMINADTANFSRVYKGTPTTSGMGNRHPGHPELETAGLEKRRGTGKAFPSLSRTTQQVISPTAHFPPTSTGNGQFIRFVDRNISTRVLVFTDGACTNNGQPNPRAGWAVVYGSQQPDLENSFSAVSSRLENQGPFGDNTVATSNRAELRAAIAALRLLDWRSEGFDCLVIATDSSYMVNGATGWCKGWVRNGWKTRGGGDVKNKDLWELLLGEVERWKERALRIELLKIPRELNTYADAEAKQIANNGPTKVGFEDVVIASSQAMTTEMVPNSRVLALCLEDESLFDSCCPNLVSLITAKVKMERATTPEVALAILTQVSPPSTILVVDGALTRQRKVWESVVDRLREGATVVVAGLFSSMVSEGEFTRFFAKLGLPWKRGSYHRATVSLRRGAVPGTLADRLPSSYSQKALFVKDIEKSAAWYTETESSNEAAVAFTKVGSGRLGYVGDVNGEESSDAVVMAMCGLLG